MTKTRLLKAVVFCLILTLLIAGCSLPYVTPPPDMVQTEAPTITAPVPDTPMPTTAVPEQSPAVITSANAASLAATNKIPASNIRLIRWSSDSSVLALSTANVDANGNSVYSATLLDGKTLATQYIWTAPDGRISDINYDGRLVTVISSDLSSMSIFDLGDGNRDIIANTPGYLINTVTFSPDGTSFAMSSNDTWQVDLREIPSNNEIKTLTGFETASPVYEAGFMGYSDTIVWKARATVQLQDIASGAMGASTFNEDFVSAYTLSPDGSLLASSAGKTVGDAFTPAVTLWDAATGSEVRTLTFAETAYGLAFSPDGSLLAVTTGNDVQVFEVSSGNLLVTLSGHSALTAGVAFSPDGISLVSAGQDNQLILWQVMQ